MDRTAPLPMVCANRTSTEPTAIRASFMTRIRVLLGIQRRVGNADDLPDRLRRDMGLPRHGSSAVYHDYLSGRRSCINPNASESLCSENYDKNHNPVF